MIFEIVVFWAVSGTRNLSQAVGRPKVDFLSVFEVLWRMGLGGAVGVGGGIGVVLKWTKSRNVKSLFSHIPTTLSIFPSISSTKFGAGSAVAVSSVSGIKIGTFMLTRGSRDWRIRRPLDCEFMEKPGRRWEEWCVEPKKKHFPHF